MNTIQKEIIKQIEFFVVSTDILLKNSPCSLVLGHFTTPCDLGEQFDARLLIKLGSEMDSPKCKPELKEIKRYSIEQLEKEKGLDHYKDGCKEKVFVCDNIKELIRKNKKVDLYENGDVSMEINAIKVEAFEKGAFSYLFTGFIHSHLEWVNNNSNVVFYNDENGEMLKGDKTHHVMGNNLSNGLFEKPVFGFGQRKLIKHDCSLYNTNGLNEYQTDLLKKIEHATDQERKDLMNSQSLGFTFNDYIEDDGSLSEFSLFLIEKAKANLTSKLWLSQEEYKDYEEKLNEAYLNSQKG